MVNVLSLIFVPKSQDSTDETLFMQLKQLKLVFTIQIQSSYILNTGQF